MPSPLSTTLLVFGAILLAVSPVAGVIAAGFAVLFEAILFGASGSE
jgi:hypothetical protein